MWQVPAVYNNNVLVCHKLSMDRLIMTDQPLDFSPINRSHWLTATLWNMEWNMEWNI